MELMFDIVSTAPWVPEDDLRLKNAVEAGASLESLAKGAVQFSRKYTLRELRDRWQSLLYDPDVSAKASASMVNLEHPPPTLPSKSSGNGTKESLANGSAKRKAQSIRRQYYATRKRHCMGMIDSFDQASRNEVDVVENTGDEGLCEKDIKMYDESLAGYCRKGDKVEKDIGFQEPGTVSGKKDNRASLLQENVKKGLDTLPVDNLVGYRNCSGLEEVGSSHSLPEPIWKTMEDIPAPTMPVHVSLENKDQRVEGQSVLPNQLKGKHVSDVSDVANAISKEETAILPDSLLLNFANGDELLLLDIDGKDAPDKSCYDNLDSLLLNSPSEIQSSDAPDICESHKSNKETQLIPHDSSTNGLEVANPSDCCHGDLHSTSNPGNDMQSSVAKQSLHCADLGDCVLNMEDPEIPSNDDFGSPIVVPTESHPTYKEAGFPASSSSNQRNVDPEINLKKEGNPSRSLTTSQIVRPGLVANIKANQQPVGVALKTDYLGRNQFSLVSRQDHTGGVNPSQSRLVHVGMKSAADGHLKEEEMDDPASAKVFSHSKADKYNDFPKTEGNLLGLDWEEEEQDYDDDDNGIPYFSDIETMILEMDLCPTDQDSSANREAARYQLEDSKKTIMRLEQCARSHVHRAIASQGALAMLYGRNLKQYIKKSEVILGRATDDVKVDIDLGREGRANKISRRQALIRMEANGSFIIKNLGKSSIFVNGKEIITGQMWGLSSGSLIEIRDMSFIFEIYDKSVRRFLDKKSDDTGNRFSMLPEGGQEEEKWHQKARS